MARHATKGDEMKTGQVRRTPTSALAPQVASHGFGCGSASPAPSVGFQTERFILNLINLNEREKLREPTVPQGRKNTAFEGAGRGASSCGAS
jgi:hypothetical protein